MVVLYEKYLVNGFRFHVKNWSLKKKTQNIGITIAATTRSFACTRDQNPISGDLDY